MRDVNGRTVDEHFKQDVEEALEDRLSQELSDEAHISQIHCKNHEIRLTPVDLFMRNTNHKQQSRIYNDSWDTVDQYSEVFQVLDKVGNCSVFTSKRTDVLRHYRLIRDKESVWQVFIRDKKPKKLHSTPVAIILTWFTDHWVPSTICAF